MKNVLVYICLSVLCLSCKSTDKKVDNICTFTRVYGYVRWFYPSDEASQIDWNKFAVYGVHKVENARNQKELKEILLELFKPIAPAIQIADKNQNINFDIKSITPIDTSGLSTVFWMHMGVYLEHKSSMYSSLRYNRDTTGLIKAFANHYLMIGEFIKKDIGNSLVVIMPLALYDNKKHTFPISDSLSLKQLQLNLNQITNDELNSNNHTVKLANIVIAWNVIQHFFPYFDVVHVDWNEELVRTLHSVYNGKNESDYFMTISKMVAKLEDGHGVVFADKIEHWSLPFMVDLIQNKVVVTASADIKLFRKGDIIKSIDGKNALKELKDQESLISGSSQLKRFRALNMFGSDFTKSEAHIILIRSGKEIELETNRQTKCNLFFNPLFEDYKFEFIDLGEGLYYLNNYSDKEKGAMEKLVHAKGIIINDLANKSSMEFISHIIKEPVWCAKWNVPINTYPDRMKTFFDTGGRWSIQPKKPFIKAKLIFLTHPYDVSYGETLLGILDNYKLGKFVGATSAATNGNVNFINLMGGYRIMWTGMKVLKHDGTQHHLIGFKPEYPVRRTIRAIKEGRDEYFEKAKEILQEEVKR